MTERSVRIQYVIAVARALIAMGGSATLREVYTWITDNGLRRPQSPPKGKTEEEHYRREVRFARQELRYGGLLDTVKDRWQVIDVDRMLALTPDAVQELIRRNRLNRRSKGAAFFPSTLVQGEAGGVSSASTSTGPRPVAWSGEVTRVEGHAETYAVRFGDTDLWKIGFASNVRSRLSNINRHLPTELIDDIWTLVRSCPWPNQLAAYAMEQEVLTILGPERTVFERVRCSPDRLAAAWEQARAAIVQQQPARGSRLSAAPVVSTRGRPKASRLPTIR